MEERKKIMEVLLDGINFKTLGYLKEEISSTVEAIINIKNSLNNANEEEISLLEKEIDTRNEIVRVRTIEGERVGLEPRFLNIVSAMILEKKNSNIQRVRH